MPTILELRQERNNLVTLARQINDKAQAEKRALTADEAASFDKHMDASDAIKTQIDKIEKDEQRSKRLTDATAELNKRNGRQVVDDPNEPRNGGTHFEFRNRSFDKSSHITTRKVRIETERRLQSDEYREGFRGWLKDGRINQSIAAAAEQEARALQVDLDTAGGFLVAPQQFAAEIIAIVDNQVFIRQLATVITLTTATTLGVPTRDVDIADSDWTSELATGNLDSSLSFGKRELMPHPLAKRILVSNKLLRAGALDVEAIVRERLAYKFGVSQEKAYLLGTGSQQPLGLFVATTNGSGLSTNVDLATGSTTGFTADGLITARYSLKPQYWAKARWLFHRTAVQLIRQLKDTNGQYLWNPSGIGQASLAENATLGDTILGLPYIMSEYVPNTFTTGLYCGMLADFSFYWIAEALTMQMQRLVELYAATNQTGYIARAEVDGAPVLEEPFVRLHCS